VKDWEKLIKILERNQACADFVAECVYAYIVNYSFETQKDKDFSNELVSFIESVYQ
jgi:hypothetical protein